MECAIKRWPDLQAAGGRWKVGGGRGRKEGRHVRGSRVGGMWAHRTPLGYPAHLTLPSTRAACCRPNKESRRLTNESVSSTPTRNAAGSRAYQHSAATATQGRMREPRKATGAGHQTGVQGRGGGQGRGGWARRDAWSTRTLSKHDRQRWRKGGAGGSQRPERLPTGHQAPSTAFRGALRSRAHT
jgi:hypothetical protein